MKKREVAIFLHDLKPGHPNRTKRLVVAYDGAGNALIRHKGRLVHPWTLPDFDAVLPYSDASFAVEISPPGQLVFGIESGEMLAVSRNGRRYTAPIDKVYATLQRWHAKEHPSGKKRRKQLFSSSEEEDRLEKDMIATAKFAIKAGAISSPVFVTLAQNAFKIARHAKEHPTGKRRRRLFTSSEQMRKYRMEHQGGL